MAANNSSPPNNPTSSSTNAAGEQQRDRSLSSSSLAGSSASQSSSPSKYFAVVPSSLSVLLIIGLIFLIKRNKLNIEDDFSFLVFFFFPFLFKDKQKADEIEICKRTSSFDDFHFCAYDSNLKLGVSLNKNSAGFFNLKLLKKVSDFLLFPKRHTPFLSTDLSNMIHILTNFGKIWPKLETAVETTQVVLSRIETMHNSPLAVESMLKSYNEDTQVVLI